MDCLDRTNVVQSVISRLMLHRQLYKFELQAEPKGDPFEKFPNGQLEEKFRYMWTDHANVISILYTGTPALKTDFTRTGKRSTQGALDDGKHALQRYYINNFCDGYNHDCLDLCLGHLKPNAHYHPRGFFTPLKFTLATFFFSFVLLNSFLERFLPHENETKPLILHAIIYLGTFLTGVQALLSNGLKFTDHPARFI